MYLEILICLICVSILINALANYFLLRRVRDTSANCESSVAVLLPLRNEAENVAPLITSIRNQNGLSDVKVCCLNDQSTDSTYEDLISATKDDSRFSIIQGAPLPSGWIGKPFALQQALEPTNSEFIVIVDADVRLTPNAIASSVQTIQDNNLDFLSAYPRQIAQSWPERLIQPLLQWSWIATVPLRLAEKLGNSSFAVANGQFFIVRRDALISVGGFKKISNRVLDDISLARLLLKSGFRGTVSDASEVASCRMYKSWKEIEAGYGKSLKTVFASPVGFLITIFFLFATGLGPLILTFNGSTLGLISLVAIISSRLISAACSGGKMRDAIWQPLSATLLIYLIMYSLINRNRISWKGRLV